MSSTPLPLKWTVGFTKDPGAAPAEFVPAMVPGAVQVDWARAKGWPAHVVGDNFTQYAWMEDVWWVYRATLELPEQMGYRVAVFVSRGIDYACEVRLNGRVVVEHEGMFSPIEVELQDAKSGDLLEVLIHPAPKSAAAPADRNQANRSCKPAVSYGWDFHPRLVPLGMWDETRVELRPAVHLARAEVWPRLDEDLAAGDVYLHAAHSGEADLERKVRWTLTDPAGKVVHRKCHAIAPEGLHSVRIAQPTLWWPHTEGTPALYHSKLELLDERENTVETRERRFGFRRAKLVMAPHQWREPASFPKSRTPPPMTMEINGRRIFCKGSNLVPLDVFYGTVTREQYAALLTLARDAHMNLLRVWGGGVVNKEAFFELADELGVMIWQEFPLACNNYPDDPRYLRVLEQEAAAIVTRLRAHPCVTLWCGGNELFNAWSGMTDQSLALRTLNNICLELDPHTPFLATSPLDGVGHGSYVFRYEDGREVFEVMPGAANTAYTEFGVPGPASVEVLETFLPPGERFPPRPGTAWETHHAFGAWMGDTWLCLSTIEHYFGVSDSLEALVARGQWMQAEGYKCIFEEARRQKPRCAMALNWCLNEPWPTAANNSLASWPLVPKPAYLAVRDACRPTLASARLRKFSWSEGEIFEADLWLLHDGPAACPAGRMEAVLKLGEKEHALLAWGFPAADANTNAAGPTLRFPLAAAEADRLTLIVRLVGRPECESRYELAYKARQAKVKAAGAATLNV